MSVLVQRVYKNRDNVTNLKFTYLGTNGVETAIDLTPAVNCDMIVHGANGGSDVYIRTSQGASMSWDADGNFKAYLGDTVLDLGDYYVTLIFYDAGHTDGQVFIHRDSERKLMLKVVN